MHEFVELLRTEWPLKTVQRMRADFFLRELSNARTNKVHECGKSRSINNQMDVPTNSGQAHLLFVTIHPPSIEQSSHFFAFLSKTIYRTVWSAVATFSSVWFHWISLAWTLIEHHLQNLTFSLSLKAWMKTKKKCFTLQNVLKDAVKSNLLHQMIVICVNLFWRIRY